MSFLSRWWVGEWQKCSTTCGDSGTSRRTVLCVQSVSLEEQRALQPTECQHLPRPGAITSCNIHLPCPSDWTAGNWSEVRDGARGSRPGPDSAD